MKPITHFFQQRVLLGAMLAAQLFAAPLAQAVTLTNSPLFLNSAAEANVFFEIDDSGSMDWEILTTQQWASCTYLRGCATLITNGRWTVDYDTAGTSTIFEYIFDSSDNTYDPGSPCPSSPAGETFGTSLYSCDPDLSTNTPYQNDWRVLSSDFNVMYYDPTQDYTPWKGICDDSNDSACADASFSAARSNPRSTEDGYSVLRNLDGMRYEVWTDDKGFSGARPDNTPNVTSSANGMVDVWDSHTRYRVSGSDIIEERITYAPDAIGLNPTTTLVATHGSGASICYPSGTTQTCRTVADELVNIANWYQYARKRSFIAKAGLASVINSHPDFRYGLSVINASDDLFVEMPAPASNYDAHNSTLLESMFELDWPKAGTPLRLGLKHAGDYYDGVLTDSGGTALDDPIIDACQKNFTVLFTDGFWNGDPTGLGDVDGDGHIVTLPDGSTDNSTLADVAKHFYDKDLSNLPDVVPPDPGGFDTQNQQHMVTFAVAFGVTGDLVDTDDDGWPDPALTESSNWGNPFIDDSPAKIDDLWHAAWNSRGAFISASKPGDVTRGLEDSLQGIDNRNRSAAAAAASTGNLQSGTLLFQTQFDPSDWHGMVLAFEIDDTDGSVIEPAIADGGDPARMPAPGDRTILTLDPDTDAATAFVWDDLSEATDTPPGGALRAALNKDIAGTSDGQGETRLAWLRGDAANEDDSTGFRVRANSKLGDIINSAAVFVGAPLFRYPDIWGTAAPENASPYSTFKSSRSARTPILYVGANDGMLHGFKADGPNNLLVEQIAYVPSPVYDNLSALTDPDYTHRFYVDGSPTYGDAYFGGAWHSVLVGGLNRGGQGIYALDITYPENFSESGSGPADTVLWEFTDADDADLGYTYSRPAVVRMHNGVWAAVFGNGYNNRDADDHVSTTGNAVLYIVDISDGSLIKKIDTGVGDTTNPNGLATPAVVDINGDNIADVIYAGDLLGNLWKFDVNNTNINQWDVAYQVSGVNAPLFTATDGTTPTPNAQPITSRPEVGRGPFGTDIMVYFGTGQYLGTPDIADTSTQTFYGILDADVPVTNGRSGLLEQTVLFQSRETFTNPDSLETFDFDIRVVSDTDIAESNTGWFMDLPDSGERVVSTPLLVGNRLIYVTIVPDSTECSGGGYSWLMEVDARNGGELPSAPFDLNNDGVFNLGDWVDIDGDGTPDHAPGGMKPGDGGFVPTPVRLVEPDGEKEHKYMPSTSGRIEHVVENPGGSSIGRQSWRQVR